MEDSNEPVNEPVDESINELVVTGKHREQLMKHAMAISQEQTLAEKKSKELNNILADYLTNKDIQGEIQGDIQGKKHGKAIEKYHGKLEEFYKTHKQSVKTDKEIHARLAEVNERKMKIDDELGQVKKGKR